MSAGRVVSPLRAFGSELVVYLVYPDLRGSLPKSRALVDFLAEIVGGEPDWERDLELRRT